MSKPTKEKRQAPGPIPLMTTTLWDYPSQNYPGSRQGDPDYVGATPSYVIWNLLQRYTQPNWLVVDPMAGSGTTLDVARALGRRALGYDLQSTRSDVFCVDARRLPLEEAKADFVFCDPPYSDHIRYSGRPECIGELDARKGPEYLQAMEQVIAEMHRVLRPDRYLGLYVCDSARKGKRFVPLGFDIFSILRRLFTPVDVIAVARHHRSLKRSQWHEAAAEGNFFLRGFNYLFVMYKEPGSARTARHGRRAALEKSAPERPSQQRTVAHRPQKRRRPGRSDRSGSSGGPHKSARVSPHRRKGSQER